MQREALYLGGPDRPLFACLHTDAAAAPRRAMAVICPPLGYEFTHSHRSVRHLADALAHAGVPALRFDYHGTGDSPGSDLDAGRLARWLADVRLMVDEARARSSGAPVCLMGIRLGATLAALVAAEVNVDWLVLWFPCASGRRYVREQQAVAAQATLAAEPTPAGALEAGGFLLTEETQQDLKLVNLLRAPVRAAHGALLIERDDLGDDPALADHLRAQGVEVQSVVCAGYADMMAEPLHTQVPRAAIDATLGWLLPRTAPAAGAPSSATVAPAASSMHYCFDASDGTQVVLVDTACRLGSQGHLFGIHTQRAGESRADLPTLVLFNSGVVHRVGPNRLYTLIARNMAALGFACVRCDIEGIGDSVLRAPGRENHPYPDTALRDAKDVLCGLREQFGARRLVPMGQCSGAYTAFLAGLADDDLPIPEILLINPLTFRWVEGDVLDTDHFRNVAHYRGSMRSSSSWKKLLRGQVNLPKVAKVMLSHLRMQLGSHLRSLVERVYPKAGTPLAIQLRELFGRDRHLSMFIASGDPGWDMLSSGARTVAQQALKRGDLSVQFIADADHTFSSEAARQRLVAALREHLVQRYLEA